MFTTRDTFAALTFAALTTTALVAAQPAPVGPPCEPAPDGSSKETADCYADACTDFKAAYNACSTSACRTLAWLDYINALTACDQSLMAPSTPADRNAWITLAYRDGRWSYSFDGTSEPGATIFRY